jgi:hypothetical protein
LHRGHLLLARASFADAQLARHPGVRARLGETLGVEVGPAGFQLGRPVRGVASKEGGPERDGTLPPTGKFRKFST